MPTDTKLARELIVKSEALLKALELQQHRVRLYRSALEHYADKAPESCIDVWKHKRFLAAQEVDSLIEQLTFNTAFTERLLHGGATSTQQA